MTMRKAVALVGFVFALATVSPVAALANDGQIEPPCRAPARRRSASIL
jgi:hypothetical protein